MQNIEKLLKEVLQTQLEIQLKQNNIETEIENLKNELKNLSKTISVHQSIYKKNISKLEIIHDEIDFLKDKELQNEKILSRIGNIFNKKAIPSQ